MRPITVTPRNKRLPTRSRFQPPQHKNLQVFPTTITSGHLNLPHEMIAEDIRRIIMELKGENDIPAQNYTTYFNDRLREETKQLPWYNDFANSMKDMYILYLKENLNRDVSNLSRHDIHFFAWVNRYEAENYHEAHNHVNSLLSGTYYVKMDPNAAPITFFNPAMEAVHGHGQNDIPHAHPDNDRITVMGTNSFHTQLVCNPACGDFFMWPSYLLHSISAGDNRDPNYERISISFNLNHNEKLDSTDCGDQMSYDFMR